ncbi:MAG TPA: 16S rRNA (guanine(966)-N(2))-methyltransferase RsmD [Marmoricola sp.]|nr:16S rRNA (guanine(966)-N(2))-methyltransferase RsmD [Nocardioidaceae bacterium]MCB8993201.1 16S rRNA (guanine(966)-N(2))-methyltransferase RsmD [Nocardioidaceae bacterium]MCO5323129.1 16S rRNA (guanine(966)-N(2))-methyltransferase RsmD [Nocardioidaceae bacterium]HMY09045.1 16S rRNA (guanine(966)-N(2))-methyltransferase RsmD [Marmoricola sp.]HRV68911.1 16S rRNA (guanine(966)-N(2))-methyltransferase RsmD [Marmoricola sp.]
MTRIIAGSLGGRKLKTLPGAATRPTTDRVKEAVFSALESRLGSLQGLSVLDLYAGSGSLGFEAQSRGASEVVFCESQAKAQDVIKANARDLGVRALIWPGPVERTLASGKARAFDLVLADPPYPLSEDDVVAFLAQLTAGWLRDGAIVVLERSTRSVEPRWPQGLGVLNSKTYGETKIWYLAYEEAQ